MSAPTRPSSYQRPRLPLPLIPLVGTKFRENGPQPQPKDTPENRPKPDNAVTAMLRSASSAIGAKPASRRALPQALDELGLPDGLVREIKGRLRS